MFGVSLWTLLVIVAPLLLIGVIAWAMMHNRTTPAEDARTEAATREMYKEQSAEDEARDR